MLIAEKKTKKMSKKMGREKNEEKNISEKKTTHIEENEET
jgi:hypothetical protein